MRFRRNGARKARCAIGALMLALLAACGGGTQVERFVPTRLVVLGDETSLINADGAKYTVNATVSATDPTLDCKINPIWVQVLANAYGFVFAQCNPTAAAVTAQMFSANGAKVDAIGAQAAQAGTFIGTDLVTVLGGANDIIEQYRRFPAVGEEQLAAELEASGTALAARVNGIANAGGKVLIATVPDMGLSPFAIAEKAANVDTDRAALLTRLTARFNAKLRANIINDGRRIGLLLGDEMVQIIVKFPTNYGFVNTISAACLSTAALPACSTATLEPATATAPAATGSTWLWADGLHLSPGGHGQLGALAATRAAGNPF
jgi:outer membrane lipase/esterase